MSDTTRQSAPDERVLPTTADLRANTSHPIRVSKSSTDPLAEHVIKQRQVQHSPTHITHIAAQVNPDPPLLPRLIEALDRGPDAIRQLLMLAPDAWGEVNSKGSLITKRILTHCIWGEHTETDALQTLQQAILTAYPPTRTTVTQYTPHLTSAINRDSTVWQHTIRNACQDHILPHPLHNPITIFNIHHNTHYTTLIADASHYSYYDPLNFPTPRAAQNIHNTLRQWYSEHSVAPPLLRHTIQPIITKSTPTQTDN